MFFTENRHRIRVALVTFRVLTNLTEFFLADSEVVIRIQSTLAYCHHNKSTHSIPIALTLLTPAYGSLGFFSNSLIY